MRNRGLNILLKLAVSASLLYILFGSIDLEVFLGVVTTLNPLIFVFLALYFAATQSLSAYRWSIVLKKDVVLPYPKLLSIYFIGMFFNNFLPTVVGGDVIKGYYLYRTIGKGDVSAASILMDRYSGFTAMMAITLVALVPGYALIKGTGLPGFFLILVGGYVVSSFFIWVESLHGWLVKILTGIRLFSLNEKIETFYRALMSYKNHREILIKIFLCSIVIQGGMIVGYFMLARGMGIGVPLGYFFLFIPLATAVSMIPVSLSGLGIREGAFVFLFTRVGAAQEEALGLSLIWFAIMVSVSFIGGVEYIRTGGKKGFGPGAEFRGLS
jgi:uncharacterized protein (TIRG00374 family)